MQHALLIKQTVPLLYSVYFLAALRDFRYILAILATRQVYILSVVSSSDRAQAFYRTITKVKI